VQPRPPGNPCPRQPGSPATRVPGRPASPGDPGHRATRVTGRPSLTRRELGPPEGERSGRTRVVPAVVHRWFRNHQLGRFGRVPRRDGRRRRPARYPSGSPGAWPVREPGPAPLPLGWPPATRPGRCCGLGCAPPAGAGRRHAGPGGPVQWEVGTGPRLGSVVRRGEALAHPRVAHSVHVEVDGLEPRRHHWYRFLWERQPANPSVLTGDIHAFLVSDRRLPGHDPDRLVRRPADHGHGRAPESSGPDPRQLRCGNRPARRGTGLEWRSLTTTYGGAWVRP
jgi:hypothetical protein